MYSIENRIFLVKIFDKEGKEIVNPYGMKTEFTIYETAIEFVKFYKYVYPKLTFIIFEKTSSEELEIFRF